MKNLAFETSVSQSLARIEEKLDISAQKDKLIAALKEVMYQADEDTPQEYRTAHFNAAMEEALELVEKYNAQHKPTEKGPWAK